MKLKIKCFLLSCLTISSIATASAKITTISELVQNSLNNTLSLEGVIENASENEALNCAVDISTQDGKNFVFVDNYIKNVVMGTDFTIKLEEIEKGLNHTQDKLNMQVKVSGGLYGYSAKLKIVTIASLENNILKFEQKVYNRSIFGGLKQENNKSVCVVDLSNQNI